jgi:hypothetical protein
MPKEAIHGNVFKILIHIEVVEDLLFYHHPREELIADGKVPWREFNWRLGCEDGELEEEELHPPMSFCQPEGRFRRWLSHDDDDHDRGSRRTPTRRLSNRSPRWHEAGDRENQQHRGSGGWYKGESPRTRSRKAIEGWDTNQHGENMQPPGDGFLRESRPRGDNPRPVKCWDLNMVDTEDQNPQNFKIRSHLAPDVIEIIPSDHASWHREQSKSWTNQNSNVFQAKTFHTEVSNQSDDVFDGERTEKTSTGVAQASQDDIPNTETSNPAWPPEVIVIPIIDEVIHVQTLNENTTVSVADHGAAAGQRCLNTAEHDNYQQAQSSPEQVLQHRDTESDEGQVSPITVDQVIQ